MFIRKKTFVLIITYLTAAVIALGAYAAVHSRIELGYRRTAEYGYSHAFDEVVNAASKLSDSLRRGAYATGAEMSASVCGDIYGNCLAAEMTMSALPFSTQELEQMSAFVGIAGDYAQSLLRTSAESGFDDAARENLAKLYKTAEKLSRELTALHDDLDSGDVLMDAPERLFPDDGSFVSAAMLDMESGMGESPSLDYDGRYTRADPAPCDDPVSEAEARQAAAEFFGLDPEQLSAEYAAESGTRCFSFDGGGHICVDGWGNVLSLSSERSVAGDMSSEELEQRARDFLAARGFGDMFLASSARHSSVLTMEFQCTDNGIRCEGDSVMISMAADDGQVYAYDASKHLKYHGEHPSAEGIVSEAEARNALTDSLQVKSGSMCYAETDGGGQRLCYDFECTDPDGETLRVLVDAKTGRQYKIVF